tara:strand:+ start:160 stop:516 length:357 start_codon:yes stop_codon:yes gene_type:complete
MFKRIIYTVAFTLSMLVSSVALSGAGHSHGPVTPPTNQQILSKASDDINMIIDNSELVDGEKLDASWKQVADKKIHKKTLRHYITAFTHPTENKTLYILLNAQGKYLGANFSGNFDGI